MSYHSQVIAQRRKALDLLKKQEERYLKSCNVGAALAMFRAVEDVSETLREHAQDLIDESTTMCWVHESWPAVRAAA